VAGGYDGTVISFAGFAPADDPRLSMYIVLDNPDSGAGGGSGGGPIFADVMSYALNHYAIPPTGQTERRLPSKW
jgi:cell division protein FtsI (penicillin-binding protein 3)